MKELFILHQHTHVEYSIIRLIVAFVADDIQKVHLIKELIHRFFDAFKCLIQKSFSNSVIQR